MILFACIVAFTAAWLVLLEIVANLAIHAHMRKRLGPVASPDPRRLRVR